MSVRKPKDFNAEETQFASRGKFRRALAGDRSFASLRLRHERGQYRKAEGVARDADADRLQLLKSLIARGSLDEAQAVLRALRTELIGLDPALDDELLLQSARLRHFFGDWREAIAQFNALESRAELPSLSRMTLYQVRSNALFELGEFQKSLADFHRLESLESLFPFGQLPLYAHTNRVRLQARLVSPELARREEEKLWKAWRAKLPSENLDPLLTLLRSAIDCARVSGLGYSREAIASFRVAQALGDDLYAGLACLDVYASAALEGTDWEMSVRSFASRHPKVALLYGQITGEEADLCETARTIALARATHLDPAPEVVDPTRIREIYLIRSGIRSDLETGRSVATDPQARSNEILRELLLGPVEKASLFPRIWGLPYADRHDGVIRTALHRVREQTGVEVLSAHGMLSVPVSLLLLDR